MPLIVLTPLSLAQKTREQVFNQHVLGLEKREKERCEKMSVMVAQFKKCLKVPDAVSVSEADLEVD